MDKSEKVGSELIVSILREAGRPLTTRQLQEETQKIHTRCLSSSVVALNIMRIRDTIKGKRTEGKSWIWWVDP
jgi:hypothetical protein